MQCFVKKEKKILTEVWKKGTNERKTQKIKKNLRITLTRNVCWFILRGLNTLMELVTRTSGVTTIRLRMLLLSLSLVL